MPPRRKVGPTPVESITHGADRRINLPTADAQEFVTPEVEEGRQVVVDRLGERDGALDPQLVWRGKYGDESPEAVADADPAPPPRDGEGGDPRMSLDLEKARSIVAGARAAGAVAGFKPLTVVVLDAGGHLVAAEREDGASIKRFEVAHGKAYGALSLGMGSRAIMARAEQQAYFVAAVTHVVGGSLVPVPGGVLVKDADGTLLGAVGASGDTSDNDEAAVVAGIEGAGLVAQVD